MAKRKQLKVPSKEKLLKFACTVAGLDKDGECPNCGRDGRGDNPSCDRHEASSASSGDNLETLNSLIDGARKLVGTGIPEVTRGEEP